MKYLEKNHWIITHDYISSIVHIFNMEIDECYEGVSRCKLLEEEDLVNVQIHMEEVGLYLQNAKLLSFSRKCSEKDKDDG